MGGTEIRQALNEVFISSPPDISTVVFVLTDGEVIRASSSRGIDL